MLQGVNIVLQYSVSYHKDPQVSAHHLLFMFYPFRVESELKSGEPPSYFAKLNEPGVIDNRNFNQALTGPFIDLADEAFLHFRSELSSKFDSCAQRENHETKQDQFESSIQVDSSTNGDHEIDGNNLTQNAEIRNNSTANILHDDEINPKIRSLNFKQRKIFDVIHAWGKITKNIYPQKLQKKVYHYTYLSQVVGVVKSPI